jgi:hypothetical protein
MWPDTYPVALYKVSYNFEENIGILNNWNKHTDTCKENPYFVFQALKNEVYRKYFFDKQTIPCEVYELVKYISSCLSVKWTDDEFIVKFKKENVDGKFKIKFKEDDFYKLTEKAMMKKKDAKKFLKWCVEYLKRFYNNIVIMYNKEI